MGRRRSSEQDSDEGRLPEGIKRVGYDADTQTYSYRDRDGSCWKGEPGARYGVLRRSGGDKPLRKPLRSGSVMDRTSAVGPENQTMPTRSDSAKEKLVEIESDLQTRRMRAATVGHRIFTVDPELQRKAIRPGSIRDKPVPLPLDTELQKELQSMEKPERTIHTPRLFLRTITPSNIPKHEIIRNDPKNNAFGGRSPADLSGMNLVRFIAERHRQGLIRFLVILKQDHACLREDLRVEGGELIGDIELSLPADERKGGNVGGAIHWEYARKGYAREAFHAVFDYALLGELELEEVFVETKELNLPFRGL